MADPSLALTMKYGSHIDLQTS